MAKQYIIIDNTIQYNQAQNMLDARMIYSGEDQWSRKFNLALKYDNQESAMLDAKRLNTELPVKLLAIESIQNGINVAEIPIPI